MDEEILIQDVTAELVGERQQEYYDGFDYGIRKGVSRVLESRPLGQLALELKVTRVVLDAVSAAAEQRERELAMWKGEASLYRGEYERVSAEFTAFVKAIAARCTK